MRPGLSTSDRRLVSRVRVGSSKILHEMQVGFGGLRRCRGRTTGQNNHQPRGIGSNRLAGYTIHAVSREIADEVLRAASIGSDVPAWRAALMFYGVRAFAARYWEPDERQHDQRTGFERASARKFEESGRRVPCNSPTTAEFVVRDEVSRVKRAA